MLQITLCDFIAFFLLNTHYIHKANTDSEYLRFMYAVS